MSLSLYENLEAQFILNEIIMIIYPLNEIQILVNICDCSKPQIKVRSNFIILMQ